MHGDPSDRGIGVVTVRSFAVGLLERVPPWLRRRYGKPLILGLGDTLDVLAQNAADAVKMRFPTATVDADALSYTGRERRIDRGPGEPASTYAARLRIWLDSHRTRGGAYALLAQLFAYWRVDLNVPIEVVAASGARESMDINGVITRDVVDWTGGGDLSTFWAQDWIFFHVSGLTATWVDGDDDTMVDDLGDEIVFDVLSGGALTDDEIEALSLVPSTWRPAHLKRCTIVLLYGDGFVYGYPPGVTYGSGKKYGADIPARIVLDF